MARNIMERKRFNPPPEPKMDPKNLGSMEIIKNGRSKILLTQKGWFSWVVYGFSVLACPIFFWFHVFFLLKSVQRGVVPD